MSRKAPLGFNTYDNKQFQNVLHIGRPRTNKGRIMAERRSEGSEGDNNLWQSVISKWWTGNICMSFHAHQLHPWS
jgi:hypothetical protein